MTRVKAGKGYCHVNDTRMWWATVFAMGKAVCVALRPMVWRLAMFTPLPGNRLKSRVYLGPFEVEWQPWPAARQAQDAGV